MTESTACLGCNYQLVGLGYDDLCPECAKPVKETMEEIDALGPAGKHARWMLGSVSALTLLSVLGFVNYFAVAIWSQMQVALIMWPFEPLAIGAGAASMTSMAQCLAIYSMLRRIRKHSTYEVIRIGLERPLLWMLVTSIVKAAVIGGQTAILVATPPIDPKFRLISMVVLGAGVMLSMHAKMQFVWRLQSMTGNPERAAARRRMWGVPLSMGVLLGLGVLFNSFLCFFVLAIPVAASSYWYTLANAAVSLHRTRLKS